MRGLLRRGRRCCRTVRPVQTWFEYRTVWAAHPWLFAYAVVVLGVFVLGVVGTVSGTPALAVLFIPSLAGAYAHHLMVLKRANLR